MSSMKSRKYYEIFTRMAKIKKARTSRVEKLLAGMWMAITTLENSLVVLVKLNIHLSLDLTIPLLCGKK